MRKFKRTRQKRTIQFYLYVDADDMPYPSDVEDCIFRHRIEEIPDNVAEISFEMRRESYGERYAARQEMSLEIAGQGIGGRSGKMTPQENIDATRIWQAKEVERVIASIDSWTIFDENDGPLPITLENFMEITPAWICEAITEAYTRVNTAKNLRSG